MAYPFAETHLRGIERGMTLPQLFMVNGIGKCLIKFQQNPQGNRVLTNELIGLSLAKHFGIDCPEYGIVKVDEFALPETGLTVTSPLYPDEPFLFKPGLQFYTRFLEPKTDLFFANDAKILGVAANPTVIAGIVVLDLLTANKDRSPMNPNLILHRENNRQHIKLIDMGSAFGSAVWTLGNLHDTTLPPLDTPLPYSYLPERLLETVQPLTDFAPYLAKLNDLNRNDFEQIVQGVPSEWEISATERTALVNYLEAKRLALPDYLNARINDTSKKWYL